ncbi:MAG TPA: hypothetical protein VEF89_13925 [Solirubrobacteraceae bacterium]|nr:hypothetical protein [Solirubrobacteraceae bacterium]
MRADLPITVALSDQHPWCGEAPVEAVADAAALSTALRQVNGPPPQVYIT